MRKSRRNKNFNIFYPNSFYSKNSIRIRSMVISAMMLALYIIFAWVGNQFFNLAFLASFLNLDISLVFLIPLVFVCNWRWWIFSGIVGGLANFIWAGSGGWIGSVYNIVLNLITLSFIFLMKHLTRKNKSLSKSITICITSFLYLVFINCVLNGIIFTPLYMNFYFPATFFNAWFIDVAKIYNSDAGESSRWFLLFIPDYWTGIFALYSAFNAIKFGVVFVLLFPVLMLLFKTNIANDYFGVIKKEQENN